MNEKTQKILKILFAAETGRAYPNFNRLAVTRDAPGEMRQISYGCLQFSESGGLETVIDEWMKIANPSTHEYEFLAAKKAAIGQGVLHENRAFKGYLLQLADTVEMQKAQMATVEKLYFKPAMKFCEKNGLTLPLMHLIVFDSYVQSGRMLHAIRVLFPEILAPGDAQPLEDKKRWCRAYVGARIRWKRAHYNNLVQRSVYRDEVYLAMIERQDWKLSHDVVMNGAIIK